jgi:hypothetical protein
MTLKALCKSPKLATKGVPPALCVRPNRKSGRDARDPRCQKLLTAPRGPTDDRAPAKPAIVASPPRQPREAAGIGGGASTGGGAKGLGATTAGSGAAGAGEDSVADAIEPHMEASRKGCSGLMTFTPEMAIGAG